MSLEQRIETTTLSIAKNSDPDDLRLQIDIRLQVDGPPQTATREDEGSNTPTAADLFQLASGIYRARRRRDKLLHGELFGEPAWDMMLALYCLPARGEGLSVTSLSYAANVAPTTGLRIQAALLQRGLVQKRKEGVDRRVRLVELSDKGRMWLENYLGSLLCNKVNAQPYLSVARA